MDMKKLVDSWTLPDRSAERVQITLRIPYTDYARLHALKAAYSDRSVNEILTDLIRVALDEAVDVLPSYSAGPEDVAQARAYGDENLEVGDVFGGPAVKYRNAYYALIQSRKEPSASIPSMDALGLIGESQGA